MSTLIVIADWNGYPLTRMKRLGKNVFECGLQPLLNNIKKYKSGCDFEVVLSINFDRNESLGLDHYSSLMDEYEFISNVLFKEDNIGMDLGAYNFALNKCIGKGTVRDILLMNTSVRGPYEDGWLLNHKSLFYSDDKVGLCGISINSHNTCVEPNVFMPHVQSFFLYFNTFVFTNVFRSEIPGSKVNLNKVQLIEEGEIEISRLVLESGLKIVSSNFPRFLYKKDADWSIPEKDIRFTRKYGKFANKIPKLSVKKWFF